MNKHHNVIETNIWFQVVCGWNKFYCNIINIICHTVLRYHGFLFFFLWLHYICVQIKILLNYMYCALIQRVVCNDILNSGRRHRRRHVAFCELIHIRVRFTVVLLCEHGGLCNFYQVRWRFAVYPSWWFSVNDVNRPTYLRITIICDFLVLVRF